jgi:hypothetical protein
VNRITDALADLTDDELDALIATVDDCPQFAPSLLAWIEHICDWEQHRHAGHEIQLNAPEAVIDSSEDAAAIGGALLLRASLAGAGPAVTALLDAIVASPAFERGQRQSGAQFVFLPHLTVTRVPYPT